MDIATERLKFWIGRSAHSPNSHDAVDGKFYLVMSKKTSSSVRKIILYGFTFTFRFPFLGIVSLLKVEYPWYLCAVEQGLMELRKLGIEHRLWEASRKEIDLDSSGYAAHRTVAA